MADKINKNLIHIDKLEEIFNMQLELNDMTFKNNGILEEFKSIRKNKELQNKWLGKFALAMSQEISELHDCANWKWWRSKVDLFDSQNAMVELIDILHFWVSACQVIGLSADDVFQVYAQKNAINIKRQQENYLVKDENDCRDISTKPKGVK